MNRKEFFKKCGKYFAGAVAGLSAGSLFGNDLHSEHARELGKQSAYDMLTGVNRKNVALEPIIFGDANPECISGLIPGLTCEFSDGEIVYISGIPRKQTVKIKSTWPDIDDAISHNINAKLIKREI